MLPDAWSKNCPARLVRGQIHIVRLSYHRCRPGLKVQQGSQQGVVLRNGRKARCEETEVRRLDGASPPIEVNGGRSVPAPPIRRSARDMHDRPRGLARPEARGRRWYTHRPLAATRAVLPGRPACTTGVRPAHTSAQARSSLVRCPLRPKLRAAAPPRCCIRSTKLAQDCVRHRVRAGSARACRPLARVSGHSVPRRSRPEDAGANPHMGGAKLHGRFEIGAHAPRQ